MSIRIAKLQETLDQFKLIYEVIPFKGYIDKNKMEIIINPAFDSSSEILMHEILHYYYPNLIEENVLSLAQDIIQDDVINHFLNEYIENHIEIRGHNLFSHIGY